MRSCASLAVGAGSNVAHPVTICGGGRGGRRWSAYSMTVSCWTCPPVKPLVGDDCGRKSCGRCGALQIVPLPVGDNNRLVGMVADGDTRMSVSRGGPEAVRMPVFGDSVRREQPVGAASPRKLAIQLTIRKSVAECRPVTGPDQVEHARQASEWREVAICADHHHSRLHLNTAKCHWSPSFLAGEVTVSHRNSVTRAGRSGRRIRPHPRTPSRMRGQRHGVSLVDRHRRSRHRRRARRVQSERGRLLNPRPSWQREGSSARQLSETAYAAIGASTLLGDDPARQAVPAQMPERQALQQHDLTVVDEQVDLRSIVLDVPTEDIGIGGLDITCSRPSALILRASTSVRHSHTFSVMPSDSIMSIGLRLRASGWLGGSSRRRSRVACVRARPQRSPPGPNWIPISSVAFSSADWTLSTRRSQPPL
jgi:hypothetical protein